MTLEPQVAERRTLVEELRNPGNILRPHCLGVALVIAIEGSDFIGAKAIQKER
jgi:hypothetical protein